MNKKAGLMTLVFATVLTLQSASALTVEAQQPQQLVDNNSLVMSPEETVQVELEFNLEGNETEVGKGPADSGDFSLNTPYGAESPPYSDGDSFLVDVTAPDQSNYTKEMSFDFEVTLDDNTSDDQTTVKTVTETINATTKIPYSTLDGGEVAWYNKSYQFTLGDTDYNISEIGNSAVVFDGENNNSFQLGGSNANTKTVNDVRVNKEDLVPNEYVKLMFESKEDVSPEFSTKQVLANTEEKQECKLGISTQSGTTIQRGRLFSFDSIDTVSGERISSVSYQLKKTAGDNGIVAEGTTSSTFATGEVEVPETLYQDNPDVETLILKLVKEDSSCQPVSKTVKLNTPYGEYIEETDKYQLQMSLDNTTTYGNITGSVVNAEEESIGSGLLEVETPEGESVEASIEDSSFNYEPNEGGTYTVTATKSGYVSSESVDVKYVADRDGDGVSNSEDECPDTEGVAANNGCPKQEADLSVTGEEKGGVNELYKNSVYGLSLSSEGDRLTGFNGTVSVKGSDASFSVEEGQIAGTEDDGIAFDETGRYTLVFNETGYEAVEETYSVVNKPVVPEGMAAPVGGGVVVLVLLLVAARTDFLSRVLGGNTSSDSDPGADIRTSLDPSGGDN